MVKTSDLNNIITSYTSEPNYACVIGNDIAAAKMLAANCKQVLVIDQFNGKDTLNLFHAELTEFPNIITLKAPLDFILRSFKQRMFDIIYVANLLDPNMLRYYMNLITPYAKSRVVVPNNEQIESCMSDFNCVNDNNYWVVIP